MEQQKPVDFASVISCVSLDKLLNVSVLLAAYPSATSRGPVSKRALTCRVSAMQQLKAWHPPYSALVFSVAASLWPAALCLPSGASPDTDAPACLTHGVPSSIVHGGHTVCMPGVSLHGYNILQQLTPLPRQTSLAQAQSGWEVYRSTTALCAAYTAPVGWPYEEDSSVLAVPPLPCTLNWRSFSQACLESCSSVPLCLSVTVTEHHRQRLVPMLWEVRKSSVR